MNREIESKRKLPSKVTRLIEILAIVFLTNQAIAPKRAHAEPISPPPTAEEQEALLQKRSFTFTEEQLTQALHALNRALGEEAAEEEPVAQAILNESTVALPLISNPSVELIPVPPTQEELQTQTALGELTAGKRYTSTVANVDERLTAEPSTAKAAETTLRILRYFRDKLEATREQLRHRSHEGYDLSYSVDSLFYFDMSAYGEYMSSRTLEPRVLVNSDDPYNVLVEFEIPAGLSETDLAEGLALQTMFSIFDATTQGTNYQYILNRPLFHPMARVIQFKIMDELLKNDNGSSVARVDAARVEQYRQTLNDPNYVKNIGGNGMLLHMAYIRTLLNEHISEWYELSAAQTLFRTNTSIEGILEFLAVYYPSIDSGLSETYFHDSNAHTEVMRMYNALVEGGFITRREHPADGITYNMLNITGTGINPTKHTIAFTSFGLQQETYIETDKLFDYYINISDPANKYYGQARIVEGIERADSEDGFTELMEVSKNGNVVVEYTVTAPNGQPRLVRSTVPVQNALMWVRGMAYAHAPGSSRELSLVINSNAFVLPSSTEASADLTQDLANVIIPGTTTYVDITAVIDGNEVVLPIPVEE